MLKSFMLLIFFVCSTGINWLTYTDKVNHLTIKYPDNWTQQSSGGAIAFLSPLEDENDSFRENVNYIIQDLSKQKMDLDGYTALTKKQIIDRSGPDAIISLTSTMLAGQLARQFIYKMKYNGVSLQIEQFWFIKGNAAYVFTYTAQPDKFDAYLSTATEMIESVKLM